MKRHAKRRQRVSERIVRQSRSDADMLIELFATIVVRTLRNMTAITE